MKITHSASLITVYGNIKKITDSQELQNYIDDVVQDHTTITLHLVDSISMSSSIIGYLNKLVLKDKIELQLKVGNSQLVDLLEDLHLTSMFHVTLV